MKVEIGGEKTVLTRRRGEDIKKILMGDRAGKISLDKIGIIDIIKYWINFAL